MKIVSPTGKPKLIAPVRSSAGVSETYLRALMRLVQAMSDDAERTLERHYKRAESQIAKDASPVSDLKAAMADLAREWQAKFDKAAKGHAKAFVEAAYAHGSRTAKARLKAAGIAIEFRPTRQMRQIMSAAVAENTKLIKSIASEYLDDVQGIVNRGIMRGGDLGQITTDLKARYGITHRRAALIARQENRNATVAMNKARDLSLGLEEAIWVHSSGGREPRPSHVQAGKERLRFKIAEGALIDGEHILPGQKINCRCFYRAILPGWNDK